MYLEKINKKKVLLFDFDGVIVDTLDIFYNLHHESNPNFTVEEFKDLFNGNPHASIKEAVRQGRFVLRPLVEFFEKYAEVLYTRTPFIGIQDALVEFSDTYINVIISSTPSAPIGTYLEKFGMRGYFDSIRGYDVSPSKTEKIKMVIKTNGLEPRDALFITDTLGDIIEARNAGVSAVGVTWGYHAKDKLMEGNPFQCVDDPSKLVSAVSEYFDFPPPDLESKR